MSPQNSPFCVPEMETLWNKVEHSITCAKRVRERGCMDDSWNGQYGNLILIIYWACLRALVSRIVSFLNSFCQGCYIYQPLALPLAPGRWGRKSRAKKSEKKAQKALSSITEPVSVPGPSLVSDRKKGMEGERERKIKKWNHIYYHTVPLNSRTSTRTRWRWYGKRGGCEGGDRSDMGVLLHRCRSIIESGTI